MKKIVSGESYLHELSLSSFMTKIFFRIENDSFDVQLSYSLFSKESKILFKNQIAAERQITI